MPTEDFGITFVHYEVASMDFLFRQQPIHDFGIDAHIETVDTDGKGTGRNIAVQIKSGNSYIKRNRNGEILYYAEKRHIQYWSTHSLPVILIIYDPDAKKGYWCDVKGYVSRNPTLLEEQKPKGSCSERVKMR
jgi:hypothetical protein